MEMELRRDTLCYARHLAQALGVSVSVLDVSVLDFVDDTLPDFCVRCPYGTAHHCDFRNAHLYGSYEAIRWKGMYIYYCPFSLTFIATVVSEGKNPEYALVSGPVLMGAPEDVCPEHDPCLASLAALPQKSPEEVEAIAQVQWSVSARISASMAQDAEERFHNQARILNNLYDFYEAEEAQTGAQYPLETERRLQNMIIKGDKQGAQELLNHLLGSLYFGTDGDFLLIKERAKELIILFSRAALDGGADVGQIFGEYRDHLREVEHFSSLDELSVFLTAIFNRFVGYVFDFGHFEHADILQKAVNYVHANYPGKLTMEDMARHVGLSRSYLSTIFKAELGSSFSQFVNTIRIDKSKELLSGTSLSLAEIAAAVGYADQSYYTKMFARLEGQSPGAYRKNRGRPSARDTD